MPFWHRTTPEEQAQRDAQKQQQAEVAALSAQRRAEELQRQQTDLALLAQGGLPSQAQQRLLEMRGTGEHGPLFTSDLSPDEAALLRRQGYTPLGLVTGSAMYHVGTAYAAAYDCEVTVLSHAYNEATRLAVSRMEQELQALDAHGAVGVRYDIVRHEWSEKTVEVQVIGTAVRGPEPRTRTRPWMSDLSGQEWWALHRAGYESVGLVYGHCTWFVFTTIGDEWNESSWQNSELSHFSQALSQARHRVNHEVIQMAKREGATGVVGVRIARRLDEVVLQGYEREHHNLIFSMIGTAIRLRPDAPQAIRQAIQILSLRDGRLTPAVMHAADAAFE